MNSITLVIPCYTITYELRDLAYKCALSHRNRVNKIIIVEDGGFKSLQLESISDIYIYNKDNSGFTRTVNMGWLLSDADYTIIANSDTELISGNLIDMQTEHVVTPYITRFPVGFSGAYFMVPKKIKIKYGVLDDRMKNFYSDVDYYERIKKHFRFEGRVEVSHAKAQTLRELKKDTQQMAILDDTIYQDICKIEYPERIK